MSVRRPATQPSRPSLVDTVLESAAHRIEISPAIDVWQAWQPRSDAEALLAHVLDRPIQRRTLNDTLTSAEIQRFENLVSRRVAGEPVALLTGSIEFAGLEIRTRHGVFVPRLSSEFAAIAATRRLRAFEDPIAVDIATGSGPLALTMAARVANAEVWGLDIAADAIALCRANARRLGLGNAHFRVSDLFHALPRTLRQRVAVITIHPPYVARGEVGALPAEIVKYEPIHTLTDSSDDGLGLVRGICAEVRAWLRPGGSLMVEVGPHLSRKTQALLRSAGLVDVRWARDKIGATRVVWGRQPRSDSGLRRR